MVGGPGESWQERQARRRRVIEEARTLGREPAGWGARMTLGVAAALWLATIAWLVTTLPESVPTHWSAGGTPDAWSSKSSALAFLIILPLVAFFPLLWLSRLVLVWPDGINAPHKEWWLDRPRRLVRFERLLREDLMVMVALTLLLMVATNLITGYAAHQPGGTVPGWWFAVAVGGFVVIMAGVVGGLYLGGRYRPDDDDPELA